MPRWMRILSYVAAAIVLVLLATGLYAIWTVHRSFPQTRGDITVPGLRGDVTVLRDDKGVPQIYADNAEDLFFAQGYVQAQDRFFEMDFRRHVTSGRLSEWFGNDTLETDEFVRTLGWRRVAERELALLDPDTRRYLDAFSNGVNAYLANHSGAQLSLEYAVLGLDGVDTTPEHWTPADSVSWLKAMAWDLRGNMEDEIDRVMASTSLSLRQVAQLYPPYQYETHQPIVDQGAVVDGVYEQDATGNATRLPRRAMFPPQVVAELRSLDKVVHDMPPLMGTGDGIGSNAWAVSGSRTSTGMPLLANDPHLAPTMPGIWYQMGLHCTTVSPACPFDLTGFTFSGVPGVVIGHNDKIAWGFTNLGPDVSDLYLEKVSGHTYLYDGRHLPMKTREETFQVAGHDPVTITVRSTRHGPIISDVSDDLADVGEQAPVTGHAPHRGSGYAVSLRWTALRPGKTADAIFELDRARNWNQFHAAAADFAVPAQNLVYADTAGHIGYQAPGRIPIRRTGHGDWPVPGWDPAYDWAGYVPYEALPNVLNPKDGYVVTANQAPVDGSKYPYYLGDSWDYGYRSQRIIDMINADDDITVDDMATMQLDTHNANAATLVPYLLKIDVPTHFARQGQRVLTGWDFTQPADSVAAAYFNVVWKNLLALTFHDQMPESVWPDGGDRWFAVVAGLLKNPESPWWDDVNTDVRETRDDILSEAMVNARDELTMLQAKDPNIWNWGRLHRLELENQSLGTSGIGPIEWLFNRGPYDLAGGTAVVDAIGWDASEGYDVNYVPSMRMVVSLANFDDSRWVNLTGASGHAFSSHYSDQTGLWATGQTWPWVFSRDGVDSATDDTLTLHPLNAG
ncbi:MAG: penicillin acylase family protein [Nocardioidaceae bacterium]